MRIRLLITASKRHLRSLPGRGAQGPLQPERAISGRSRTARHRHLEFHLADIDLTTVWVTARESDQLLAFSATKLRSDPAHSLLAAVRVGEAPVGLALIHGGRDVVVADSNRFRAAGAGAQLTVVDATSALAHRPALVGTISSGSFPREMALEPDGNTLLVGNFGSDQLETVALNGLP